MCSQLCRANWKIYQSPGPGPSEAHQVRNDGQICHCATFMAVETSTTICAHYGSFQIAKLASKADPRIPGNSPHGGSNEQGIGGVFESCIALAV